MQDEEISRVANPRRPIAGEDPETSRLAASVVALLGEVTILRERLDTIERLAERAAIFTQADIEDYAPDAAADEARGALRRRTIARVLRPYRDAAGAAAGRARSNRSPDQETGA